MSKKNKKETNLYENKELKEAKNSNNESVEAPLKALDIVLKKRQLIYCNFLDTSVKATLLLFYDVGSSDSFDIKHEIFKDNATFNKRQRGELEND